MFNVLRYLKRPDINEQTTARFAYQRYNGYSPAAYNGNGGFTVMRSLNATNPASIAVGNTLKLNDPTVTGNNAGSVGVNPLSENTLEIRGNDRSF